MATVTFRDETMTGKPIAEFSVADIASSISLRDLIRLRVHEEVARHNAAPREIYRGLVRPTDAETALNGFRLREARVLDAEKQADIAMEAFGRNGFIVLVGDRQVDDPDFVVDLERDPAISFVKLVALVGG